MKAYPASEIAHLIGGHKVEDVGELQRVDVRPGDVFVIHTDAHLSPETILRIREEWDRQWSPDYPPKLILMTSGLKLGVVRQEEQ